ncbi:DUF4253 domain-containing protein [Xanthobacter autotrophicus DSM 431]|uniref:DUF4253 domain-containing protein n=1 Tax=Xanthobacter nonsaccharivorans TaxID=3119912 RepID=UPI003726C39E
MAEWPYPLRLVPGTEATAAWYEEAAIGAREGFSPILITPETAEIGADESDVAGADIPSPDSIVDTYVRKLIFQDWANQKPALLFGEPDPEDVAAALAASEEYQRGGAYAYDEPAFADIRELPPDPPEAQPQAKPFGAITSLPLKGPFPQVAITRLPPPDSWRAPLLLGFGGWNACPEPAMLAAFARRWKLLHGADIAAVTQDTLEFVVERPPATFEEATRLAKEHYIAGIELGDMDMSDYIAALRSMRRWYFWWD